MSHWTCPTVSQLRIETPNTSLKATLPDPCYLSIVTTELVFQLAIRILPDDSRSLPDPRDKS